MKYVTTVLASTIVTGFLLGISVNGFSQDSKTQPADQNLKDQSKKPEAPAPVPVYTPPKRGAQAGASAALHAASSVKFFFSVLAPDHSGFTTSEQPSSTGLFPNRLRFQWSLP